MRSPGRDAVVDRFSVFGTECDVVAAAGALECVVNDVSIGLPVLQHLIDAVGLEASDEFVHARSIQKMTEQIPSGCRHLEIDQRAVAIKGHVFRPEAIHVLGSCQSAVLAEHSCRRLAECAEMHGHSAEGPPVYRKPSTTFRSTVSFAPPEPKPTCS